MDRAQQNKQRHQHSPSPEELVKHGLDAVERICGGAFSTLQKLIHEPIAASAQLQNAVDRFQQEIVAQSLIVPQRSPKPVPSLHSHADDLPKCNRQTPAVVEEDTTQFNDTDWTQDRSRSEASERGVSPHETTPPQSQVEQPEGPEDDPAAKMTGKTPPKKGIAQVVNSEGKESDITKNSKPSKTPKPSFYFDETVTKRIGVDISPEKSPANMLPENERLRNTDGRRSAPRPSLTSADSKKPKPKARPSIPEDKPGSESGKTGGDGSNAIKANTTKDLPSGGKRAPPTDVPEASSKSKPSRRPGRPSKGLDGLDSGVVKQNEKVEPSKKDSNANTNNTKRTSRALSPNEVAARGSEKRARPNKKKSVPVPDSDGDYDDNL